MLLWMLKVSRLSDSVKALTARGYRVLDGAVAIGRWRSDAQVEPGTGGQISSKLDRVL